MISLANIDACDEIVKAIVLLFLSSTVLSKNGLLVLADLKRLSVAADIFTLIAKRSEC